MHNEYSGFYKSLGLNISYYRKKNHLTQLQLAEALGIDRSHMSGIELATNAASLDLVFKICKVLEISPKELFDFR